MKEFRSGRPRHMFLDDFCLKHPAMDLKRRAKIFSPFDALRGFGDAISSKETSYTDRILLDDSEQRSLNRKLFLLHNYTCTDRMSKENRILVTITRFLPREDSRDLAFLSDQGIYTKISGMVLKVDDVHEALTLQCESDRITIDFEDILDIIPQQDGLFDELPDALPCDELPDAPIPR